MEFLGSGSELVRGAPGARPEISILASDAYVPWSGHLARHSMPEVMEAIKQAKTSLVFVNTRAQAERTFQDLWRLNEDNLAIALHHGSLAPAQRRKVESAMTKGNLRAVVCTSTLDLAHRLGRSRQRHLHWRAEGRRAAGPAHRPRQSPPRRAKSRDAGSVEPLRGTGM